MRLAVVRKVTMSDEQHSVIRAELARILGLPEFSASRRCSDFLAYSVEQTLQGGQEAELKERTIAVEVFGRPPSYDSNEDSIVRVTARDVRKRLAQCYLGVDSDHVVRIDLPAGSYRAEFRWPEVGKPLPAVEAAPASAPPQPRRWWIAAASAVALAAAFLTGWSVRERAAPVAPVLRAFWAPMLQNPGTVLMCVGTPTVYDVSDRLRGEYVAKLPADARMRPFVIPFGRDEKVAGSDLIPIPGLYAGFGNVHTTADLVALMGQMDKTWQVRAAGDVSFAELRMSPAILIGGESNVWTQPLTTELRFYFSREGEAVLIRDRTHPEQRWPPSGMVNNPKAEDYAIVSRILDSKTGKALVFLGGRTQSGTQAAGELVTNGSSLERALSGASRDWPKRNLQLVIRTQIHGMTPSGPSVMASHIW